MVHEDDTSMTAIDLQRRIDIPKDDDDNDGGDDNDDDDDAPLDCIWSASAPYTCTECQGMKTNAMLPPTLLFLHASNAQQHEVFWKDQEQ